jgi:hypothetical protein
MLLIDGKRDTSVFLPVNASAQIVNAADLLASELEKKTGTRPLIEHGRFDSPCHAIVISPNDTFQPDTAYRLLRDIDIENAEGFAIRFAGGHAVLAGATGAGVIYAVDHVLDSAEYAGGTASIAEFDIDDAPDSILRGATFTTHAYKLYAEDDAQLAEMKKLVRFYARNRVNLITIEATGRKWPGDLSPVVTWKYFPVLHDESRDEVVAKRLRNINELIDFAHSWGIQVVMYTSEFNHEPDLYQRCPELMGLLPDTWKDGRHNYIRGCLCLSKKIAWDYWRAKVRESMEAMPELDGLELWTAEVPSEFGICACAKCKEVSRTEWLEKFITETRRVMDEVNPRVHLYVKTFQSSQGSLEVERFGPLKGKLPHNTTIVTKGQFGDMAYLNDPHPLLGVIQDGAEATEFDVGGEYRGCAMGATVCCIPEYLAERMRLYYARGVRRFYARHAIPTWPNKDLLDINDVAFYKLAWDINTDIEKLWFEWAEKRFGHNAAPLMVELLKLSDEAVNKSLYIRGACANRHYFVFSDNLDSFRYMMVDLSAQMIEGGLERLEPTPENIAAIIAEKDEAVGVCWRMIEIFDEVAPMLDNDVRSRLETILQRMRRIAVVMRAFTEAAFTYFAYERCFSVRERDGMRPVILDMLKKCEEEIDKSQQMSIERAEIESFFGITKIVDFERARKMCEEIRALVNFRLNQKSDYSISVTPATVGHPNTYSEHRRLLREIFGLPGEG